MRRKGFIRRAGPAVLVGGTLAALAVFFGNFLSRLPERPAGPSIPQTRSSSSAAFAESYLDPARGVPSTARTACSDCHASGDQFAPGAWERLRVLSRLDRDAWAERAGLIQVCGACHRVPDPRNLPRRSWIEVMPRMSAIMAERKFPPPAAETWEAIRHFYLMFSLERQRQLDLDPDPRASPIPFTSQPLGRALDATVARPMIGQLQAVDLDRDGAMDVLVCDTGASSVNWIHRVGGAWLEEPLGSAPHPARTQIVTNAATGRLDLVVACLGGLEPTDALLGRVVVLTNDGAMRFTATTLLDGVSRVVDVQPGDFNADGRVDFVVAAYGFINHGAIGWLENKPGARGGFEFRQILQRTGAVNGLPADLDGDGRLDFVALFAQEHERICAFLNEGAGGFRERVLFQAATPAFGSSGIQLVDLDGDGDLDILYTNGDNLDLPTIVPRPFHGVQWLENRGELNFVWHDLYRCYGAYSASSADLNGDGQLDIVVTALFNDWSDPRRASLLWLENNGHQRFTPHTIATRPTHLITVAVADFDRDGAPEIAAGSMHGFPPFDRIGRVTMWKAEGRR